MKIAVVGAGAMGSLFGWYLSPHAEVWLLDSWAEHVAAINTHGLVCERDGAVETRLVQATTDPMQIGSCDVAIVMVKAHQTAWAAGQVLSLLQVPPKQDKEKGRQGEHAPRLLSLAPSLLHSRRYPSERHWQPRDPCGNVGEQHVSQGVTALGATLLGPGRVRHAGMGQTIFSRSPEPQRAAELAALFNASGLPADTSDEVEALVWRKLLANVGINALTALLRVPNGTLVSTPEAAMLMEQAVQEAVAVAEAAGIRLNMDDPVAQVRAVAEATAANRSSMLQDVLRGSPTEIATINGAIVREGQRLGVPTPVNALLVTLVQALDATREVRVG